MILFFIYIFFIHYIADFVFQTNWMALNKSKSHVALASHVLTYSAVLLVGLSLAMVGTPKGILMVVMCNFVAHYLTDAVTSRISSYFFQKDMRNYFWYTIGFDQFIHQATLISLVSWLLF